MNGRYRLMPAIERFWDRVDVTRTCWLWTGKLNVGGYAKFAENKVPKMVHRWAYERWVSIVPDGLQLDHLCRVRHCVNPAHLEAVTAQENSLRGIGFAARNARKTHCSRGHAYDESNTIRHPSSSSRRCYVCEKVRWTRANAAKRVPPRTHCANGHPYEGNLYRVRTRPNNLICIVCKRANDGRSRRARRSAQMKAVHRSQYGEAPQ